jgi:hypothetical protein
LNAQKKFDAGLDAQLASLRKTIEDNAAAQKAWEATSSSNHAVDEAKSKSNTSGIATNT